MIKLQHLLCMGLLFYVTTLSAQNRTISGKVSSSRDQSPIPGVTVTIKGSSRGVATGPEGTFTISAPSGAVTLSFSSVGFVAKDVSVGADQASVDVNLDESSEQMSEVVVTALGITREAKTLVYATQTVKPSTLVEARDPNNVLNSLTGKVANAVVTQGSGGPGSGARIVLRGNRSIQGSNNALIVVDGVPIQNGTNGTAGSDFGSVQGSDGASNINPDDIESVSVLRGASAAALYGSAAGNGVIVITTKKGAKGKIAVTLNSGIAMETPFALPKFQNTYGQGNGGVLQDTLVSGESWGAKMDGQQVVNHLGEQTTYTAQPDNVKDFFRTGKSTNNSIGVTGGSDKMQTYLSYTHNLIEGIVPRNDLARHTINLRLSNQISSKFSTDAKVTYIAQDIDSKPRTGEENSPVMDIYQIPRNVPLETAKNYETVNNVGVPVPTNWPSTLSSIYQNPYWMIYRSELNEKRDRLMGFLSAKYQITPWLNLTGRANIDRIFDRFETKYSQGTILWASQAGGFYEQSNLISTQKWFDAILSGENDITKDLKITYNAGAIYQDNRSDQGWMTANGLNIPNKFGVGFATNPAMSSSNYQVQTQSVFGQFNLSFKEFLFLDASLRNDWSSPLPAPHTFSYPSVGLSAIISDMVQLPSLFSFLKASVNYAQVGNGGQAQILNVTYGYSQGAGPGFLQRSSTFPIPNLKPEIVKNLEFNVESKFLANRLSLNLTYYKSNSFNQLLRISLPTATGYGTQYINAGNVQNTGFEATVNGTPVQNKDFSWEVGFNFATNKNKIVELSPELKRTQLGGGYGRSATPVIVEGGSYGDLVAQGWLRSDKVAGAYVVTAAGVPVASAEANGGYEIGNFNPKATLGLSNTFNYKGIYARILIDGRVGGTIVSGTEMNLAFSGITEGTEKFRDANSWALGGVDADGSPVSAAINAQQFWQIASGKRYGLGEFFAYDATNFRVRELSLGYDIPLQSTVLVKNLRLSLVARNLLWLYRGSSKFDIPGIGKRKMWFDPDLSNGNGNWQGIEYGALPSTRSVGLNLQVTF
jgi:TonB-linked SusC/RagA family outer membrane protein